MDCENCHSEIEHNPGTIFKLKELTSWKEGGGAMHWEDIRTRSRRLKYNLFWLLLDQNSLGD